MVVEDNENFHDLKAGMFHGGVVAILLFIVVGMNVDVVVVVVGSTLDSKLDFNVDGASRLIIFNSFFLDLATSSADPGTDALVVAAC